MPDGPAVDKDEESKVEKLRRIWLVLIHVAGAGERAGTLLQGSK